MSDELKFKNLVLNLYSYKCFVGNDEVSLCNKEFDLLRLFLKNAGKVLSRTEILEEVWDRNICCSTNTVDVHVSKLRKKLQQFADKIFIKTVHCVGYVLN